MIAKPISVIAKRVSSGLTPLRSNSDFWTNGTIPWLKTEQLGEKYIYDTTEKISDLALKQTSIKLYPPNTLSIAMYGQGKTRGNLSIIKAEMATNQACCNIEIDPDLAYYEYVYYFLKTQYNELRNLSSGVRKNLNSNDIKNFTVRLPKNLSDQKKIAAVLSALDAKIDCNNRINAELEAMAKTLYDYWFVQFDFPFDFARGKPARGGKPYKSSGGKMVYNPTLKREIPVGWEAQPLASHLTCNINKLSSKHGRTEINYLDTANLTENRIGEIRHLVTGVDNIPSRAKMIINANDILYSTVRPNQHHFGIIRHPVENMVASTGFVVLSCKKSPDFNSIFYLHLTSKAYTGKLIRISESAKSSYPSISPEDILDLNFALPNENTLLENAAKVLNPIFDKIALVQRENKQLETLRDWLLPMLMNGQVTVQ